MPLCSIIHVPIVHTFVQRAIERFDQESYWIAAEICQHYKLKTQMLMIAKFIRVAMHCHRIGNYYSMFSILGALNFPEVSAYVRMHDDIFKWQTFAWNYDVLRLIHTPVNVA